MSREQWFNEYVRQENMRQDRIDEIKGRMERERALDEEFGPGVVEKAKRLRRELWNGCPGWKEDDRIQALETGCIALCNGDAQKGFALSIEARLP